MPDGDVSTERFSELAEDRAAEAVSTAADSAGSAGAESRSDLVGLSDAMPSTDWLDAVDWTKWGKRLLKGDGPPVEDIQEQYGCGEGMAYIGRGVCRVFDADEVPPVMDVAIGVSKLRGSRA